MVNRYQVENIKQANKKYYVCSTNYFTRFFVNSNMIIIKGKITEA